MDLKTQVEFSAKLYGTLEAMKSFVVDNKSQLVRAADCIELSSINTQLLLNLYPETLLPSKVGLRMFDMPEKDIYGNIIEVPYKVGLFQFDNTIVNAITTDYSTFDTKEFWNYLHSDWKYCDVISHSNGNSIEAYRKIKGMFYTSFMRYLDIKSLKGKKILEIGPGYGLFPDIMNKIGIKIKYWCLDVVERFKHDNFVVGNGKRFPDSINENFDLIFMLDVSSHIPAKYMESYLISSMNSLSDDGKIILTIPPGDGCCIFFGTVTHSLEELKIVGIADKFGFEVIKRPFYIIENCTESNIITIQRKAQ
jgi:hypothetical protein